MLNLSNLNQQLLALLKVVSKGTVEEDSPLAEIAGAVLGGEAEIASGDMSLSAFNVQLSLCHGAERIIDNITEHADTPAGYFNASWDEQSVTVCIADGGKTIYGSYLDRQFDNIDSDQAALHAAVSGVSTKNRPGAENRGFGISTSADMVIRGLDSMMIILSGRGLLIRNKERNDFTELPEPIYMPGTLVCFTLPIHNEGFTFYDYIGG